jgi:hypothetical protein
VDENEKGKDAFFTMNGFPERPVPGALLLRYGQFHVVSGDLLVECASAWCAERDRHL